MKLKATLLDDVASSQELQPRIVRLAGWQEGESSLAGPLVQWAAAPLSPQLARWAASISVAQLRVAAEKNEEALVMATADGRLVITTLIAPLPPSHEDECNHVFVDGHRVEIRAQEELVLSCGDALIRLTKDGRIAIRGIEVETRARGTHRIRGGTVEIN